MTIEIADRLVKLRKEKGLSQEELAEKLGLSRQAVSKWERAEASPDTDNLICLAKLYGVSLDELLNTDEDIETIVKEQVKEKREVTEDCNEENDKSSVSLDGKGLHCIDDDGSRVDISSKGVDITDKDGNVKHYDKNNHPKVNRGVKVAGIIEGSLFIVATIAYILMGFFLEKGWAGGWVVFLLPEIICSIIRAIANKKFCDFNMAFTSTFTFFFVCMIHPGLGANLWHPMWVVFLLIPLYYASLSPIDKLIHHDEEYDEKGNKIIDVKINKEK